jgi:ArsR family transcriptional regulator
MEDWVGIFKALGDETRLKILALLFEHGFCVSALARLIGKSEAAVSQHIRILRKAGILKGEKRNGYTFYEINRDAMEHLTARINEIVASKPERRECCHHMTGEHQYCEIYTKRKINDPK